MTAFLRYALLDGARGWLLRGDAARPQGAWRLGRVAVGLGLLGITWGSAGPTAVLIAPALAAADPRLLPGVGLLLGVAALVLGALTAVAVTCEALDSEPFLRALPVPRSALFLPDLLTTVAQGLFVVLLVTAPLAFVSAAAVGGSIDTAVVAALAAIACYLLASALFSVIGGLVLKHASQAGARAVLSGVVLGAFALLVVTAVLAARGLASGGLVALGQWAATVEAWLRVPLLTGLGTGQGPAPVVVALGVLVPPAGFVLSSWLLETGRVRLLSGGDAGRARALALPFAATAGGRLGPFLRKDLTIALREPWVLLRQVLTVVAFLVLLLYVLPARQGPVLLFVVLALPATMCGATQLHAVGQEGTLITLIRALGAADRLLASKLAVGLATVPAISAVLALLALRVAGGPAWTWPQLAGIVALVAIAAAIDVVLAIGVGSTFADLSVKRIGKERGASLGGEFTYWLVSGLGALGLYLVADGALRGRWSLLPGLLLTVVVAVAAFAFYQAGKARLVSADRAHRVE